MAHAHRTAVFKDWGFFAVGSASGVLESLLGLGLVSRHLSNADYSEWVVLTTLMTVVGALSQWGLKTPYMQLVVDDTSRPRHLQSLRAATLFLSSTGLVAGCLVMLVLAALFTLGQWQNAAVLWMLPLLMASGNAQMLLVTDLRIRRRLAWVSALNLVRLPAYALLIFGLSSAGVWGLPLIFGASLGLNLVVLATLWWIVRPGFKKTVRWGFLPAALRLGTPIMLGLLVKYASDAVINLGIRWLAPIELAGDWGKSYRLLEPSNALYFGALMMAWAPNAIHMAGSRTPQDALVIQRESRFFFVLALLGIPLALVISAVMQWQMPGLQMTSPEGLLALVSLVLRMSAFSALAMANYGITFTRRYGVGLKFYWMELIACAVLVLPCLYMGYFKTALVLVGCLPWVVVLACYRWLSPRLMQCHSYSPAPASNSVSM